VARWFRCQRALHNQLYSAQRSAECWESWDVSPVTHETGACVGEFLSQNFVVEDRGFGIGLGLGLSQSLQYHITSEAVHKHLSALNSSDASTLSLRPCSLCTLSCTVSCTSVDCGRRIQTRWSSHHAKSIEVELDLCQLSPPTTIGQARCI